MITVILAGGHSKRFAEVGFPLPKSLLPMPDGRTLLEWQVDRLPTENVLFVSVREYRKYFASKLAKVHIAKKIRILQTHWLDDFKKGPLDTLWHSRSFIDKDEELLIVYCDVLPSLLVADALINTGREWGVDATILGYYSDDKRFDRIEGFDVAVSGFYYFKSGKKFVKLARRLKKEGANGIADVVYASVTWNCMTTKDLVDLGVPRDYKSWMAEQGSPVEDW